MRKILFYFIILFSTIFVGQLLHAQIEFVENKGQWNNKVKYKGDFSSGSFFLENGGFTVALHNPADLEKLAALMHGHQDIAGGSIVLNSHAYKVNFLESSLQMQSIPDKIVPHYNNYFLGKDQSKWASECKIFQAVTYQNVYPNIDVRYYSDGNKLKYDLIVHPGGNINAIAMKYSGIDKLQVKNQELMLTTSVGEVKELYPYSYQVQNGKRISVDCKYVVNDGVVRFKVKDYSSATTLVIDPTIIFSTYTGSSAENWGYTATPGPDGSFFAGGIAFATGYPVSPGAYQTVFGTGNNDDQIGAYDMAIFKFSPDGTSRSYATYLGGNGNEQPHSMVCDREGNLIIAGRSSSANYPRTNFQLGSGAGFDIVVTKLNASGSAIIGSVKIGGSNDDGVNIRSKYVRPDGADATRRNYGDDARGEVILDAAGNIYLASCTQSSSSFPVLNALQPVFGGGRQDGVIMKFTPNLSNVLFSTYYGGLGDDACFVLSLNPLNGNLYVAGGATSANLPGDKTNVITPTYQGGVTDGFVTCIQNNGSSIIKTTYLGTGGDDLVYGIQFDKFGFPYVMGTTTGSWQLTPAGVNTFGSGGANGKQFIGKLQPDLSAYVYSTVFGTNASAPNISPVAFLVDRCQNVYISGWGGGINTERTYPSSGTNGLPFVDPLRNPNGTLITEPDGSDFYFFVMERDAQSQLFGSHFGQSGGLGDHVDGGTSRFDANGIIYQAICACKSGNTPTNFPVTPGTWSTTNRSQGCNQAAVKIEMNFAGVAASIKATIDGIIDTIGCVPLTVHFTDTLAKGQMYIWDYGDPTYPKRDTTYAPDNDTSHTYNQVGTYTVMLIAVDPATCNISDTAYITVRVGSNIVTPDFSFSKVGSCESLVFQFTNITTAVLPTYTNQTFIWDFGDGTAPYRSGPEQQIHAFPSTGTYPVRLTVDDATFCNSPVYIDKVLRISPNVEAQFNTPARGCVPYDVVFDNTSTGGTDFIWELGDGNTSTEFEPNYTYNNVGSYNVRLIAIDPNTCNLRDTTEYFTITVFPVPVANFTWSPNPPIENTPTTFTNQSVGANRYLWDFGDGEFSPLVNPVHQYNATGTYRAKLYAFNDADCVDSITNEIPILIVPVLDVPNAFTPGRFAGNDVVKVAGFGIGTMSWKIYNRWGTLVFQTTNRNQGWDGRFKGVLQPMDVYTYTLDVEFTDGKKYRKTGDINLLR